MQIPSVASQLKQSLINNTNKTQTSNKSKEQNQNTDGPTPVPADDFGATGKGTSFDAKG
jgi:hypothetical protein